MEEEEEEEEEEKEKEEVAWEKVLKFIVKRLLFLLILKKCG